MRLMLIALCVLMAFVSLGCTSRFTGEWLEQGVPGPSGKLISPTGERRMR